MLAYLKNLVGRFPWLKRKYFLIPSGLVVVLALGYFFVFSNGNGQELITADRGEVIDAVVISGKTQAISSVDLAFERSGRVDQIGAEAGEEVKAGQIIASLDQGELSAQLLQAKANLRAEQIKLAELKRGTRPEELAVTEAKYGNNQASFNEANKTLQAKIREAYSVGDDAIRNKADQIFGPSYNWYSNLTSFITSQSLREQLIQDRINLDVMLGNWSEELATSSNNRAYADVSLAYLNEIEDFLTDLARGVNDLSPSLTTDLTTTQNYKTIISTARTNIATMVSSLSTAIGNYDNAKTNLTIGEKELTLARVGNSLETIEAQQARVDQYEAQVLDTLAQMRKNVIISPINGVVALQDAKVGEIVNSGVKVASVITEGNLEVEAYAPEVYIGRLTVGNEVKITLDALPDVNFMGRVTYLDPAATDISGVPNYKVLVTIKEKDERLKSGLTANLTIETAKVNSAVRLPRFALIQKGSQYFVKKAQGRSTALQLVQVGLLGSDGFAEIKSGLTAGEQVIVESQAQ